MANTILPGQKYGRLMTVSPLENSSESKWICLCECGREVSVRGSNLRRGHTKSCGCLHDELSSQRLSAQNSTHGKSKTRLYRIWTDMRKRCNNANHWAFNLYGGRGITVCDEWCSFSAFAAWSENNGYSDTLTIDRIDNDIGYSLENCRWVTRTVQANNRSIVNHYSLNGTDYTLRQLCDLSGLSYRCLRSLIHQYGMSIEEAVSKPRRGGDKKHGTAGLSSGSLQ